MIAIQVWWLKNFNLGRNLLVYIENTKLKVNSVFQQLPNFKVWIRLHLML